MNKFIAIAAAGVIAVSASLAAVAPSQAFYPHNHYNNGGNALAFGLFGFAAGAIAAGAYQNNRWYHRDGFYGAGWDNHVAACEDAYRTYDPRTDTYVRRFSNGQLGRVQCEL